MLSDDRKLELCEEILQSGIFIKSPKSSSLLKYLVKSTIAGDYLKEDIIDLEFFGNTNNYSKTTPRVRVSIYNLRKKINNYYASEGSQSIWRLHIDKGQYNVRFEKQNLGKSYLSNLTLKKAFPYVLLLILGLILILQSMPKKTPKIWEAYFKKNKNTTVVIGDVFGMNGKTIAGSSGWTRDYSINSIDEYLSLINRKPELKKITKPSDYSYTTSMGAISIKHLSKFYTNYNSDFEIRFSTNTSVEDIKKGNLIYVGPIKNENKFISLFNDANQFFELKGKKLILKNHPTLPNQFFSNDNGSLDGTDFSIVSRFKSPLNNEYILFFSNHDIGIKATVEKFTNLDSLAIFEKKHLVNHQNFTALFTAHGKERTNLKLKTLLVVPF